MTSRLVWRPSWSLRETSWSPEHFQTTESRRKSALIIADRPDVIIIYADVIIIYADIIKIKLKIIIYADIDDVSIACDVSIIMMCE